MTYTNQKISNGIKRKTITILIVGIMVFTAITAFSATDYNSSRSNTSTAILNQQIGDILLKYGAGGAEVNKVTDALAVGISKAELEDTLIAIGIGEEGVNEVFVKLDELGVGFIKLDDEEKTVTSCPDSGGPGCGFGEGSTIEGGEAKVIPAPDAGDISKETSTWDTEIVSLDLRSEVSTPDTGDTQAKEDSYIKIEGIWEEAISALDTGDDSVIRKRPGRTSYQNITLKRTIFQDIANDIIQNIRAATPEERENLVDELQANRRIYDTEILSMSLSIRENAKELRENFRERVETVIGHVDHGKTARIVIAHGKGLRMINRFRSATARFEHILGRLESRVGKFEARGVDVSLVTPLIEEAKNMSLENEVRLEELKAKYESLLEGENSRGIGEEARAIAKELKVEIENLHSKLREIADEIRLAAEDYNSSRSNTQI